MPDGQVDELANPESTQMGSVRAEVDDFGMREVTCLTKKLYELRVII